MLVEVVTGMTRLGVEVGIMEGEEAVVVIKPLSVGMTTVEVGSGEGLRLDVSAGSEELIVSGISISVEATENITDACVGATDIICVVVSGTAVAGIAIASVEFCPLLGRSNRANVNTVQKSGATCFVVAILRINNMKDVSCRFLYAPICRIISRSVIHVFMYIQLKCSTYRYVDTC